MASGVVTLVWHNYHDFDQLRSLLNATDGPIFLFVTAAAQIAGGAAVQFRRTAKIGAAVLAVVYLVFALLCVPRILATPKIYDSWGNFFEPFSLATAAAIVCASFSSSWTPQTICRVGRMLFGLCVASFALEQAFYLDNTAGLVPKWMPPSPMFWALTTTVLLALAAVALVVGRPALLASRLLTVMLALFGLLVWVPLLVANPASHANWSEFTETVAIAGAAWVLADLLAERQLTVR